MNRITIVRASAALAVLAVLAVVTTTSKHTVPAVYASPASLACGNNPNATLTGNYAGIQPAGFTSQGPTTGSEVPWQVVGVFFFDGNGGITTDYTAAVNGAIFTDQVFTDGTYNLSTDARGNCTGTLSIPDIGYDAKIYVVGGGAEVLGISTNTGSTATFDLKKQ